jgi:hypothetical protein
MARKDMPTIDPYTYGGIDLSGDMNSWQTALETMHKGSGRPTYAQGGMLYIDDAADPIWTFYVFDGTNDIELFDVNVTDNTVIFDPAKIDVGAHADDEILAIVAGVAQFAAISSIQIDPSTDFNSGLVPNANLNPAMRLGTDDSVQGSIYLYGDSATAGAVQRFYNAASEDTTVEYFVFEANSHLYIGPNTDTDQFIIKQAGGAQLTAGTLELGVNDTTVGSLYIYGAATTSGGFIRLYNAGDEDTTYEYYHLTADTSGLVFGNDTGNLFLLGDTQLTLAGLSGGTAYTLALGSADTRRGRIFLYGDNNTLGGTVYFYAAASDDTTYDYWTIQADADALWLGPDADNDRYAFYANRLEATAAGFRAMSHAYSAPATGTGLETYYDSGVDSAYILSYNRTGSAYKGLLIGGSTIAIGGSLLGNGPVLLAINSTSGYVQFPSLTTTQRNALSMGGVSNAIIWNSTTAQYERWNGSAWAAL